VIGRSIVWSGLAGCALSLIWPVKYQVRSMLEGAPSFPTIGDWEVLLGPGRAAAEVLRIAAVNLAQALVLAFILVVARVALRRRWAAILATAVIWMMLGGVLQSTPRETAIEAVFSGILTAGLLWALLKHGVLGAAVMRFVVQTNVLARTVDWSAWHAVPSWLALAAVAALLMAGARAASVALYERRETT
jgi:hypothetical protein